jgi:hypothetical protein
MKKLFSILILTLLIVSCNSNTQTSEEKGIVDKNIDTTEFFNKTLNTKTELIDSIKKCDCKLNTYSRSMSTDLTFQNSNYSRIRNDSLFEKWSQDSLKNQVKSISFVGYDTIPEKFSVFKSVDRLKINNRNGIFGLDIFPKVKTINFFGSTINLNTTEKWPSRIEALFGQKTSFKGLDSFKKMSSLRVIHLAYSRFDNFPKDFEKLDCLNEITLGAYLGTIDLSTLDLSQNQCLRKVEFQTWYNTLSGIPTGILNSNIEKITIHHQKLTTKEKEELKNIKNSR